MKVSIATPCLNCVETIGRTIESVLREKDDSIEYVVIDGGSTDGTLEIINQYKEYIDVFISEKDNGLYDAFNKCIRNVSGDYVIILAADDYLLNGAINRFKENVRMDTDIWSGSVVIKYDGYYQYMFSENDLSMLKYCCSLRHPATFFKREIFNKYNCFYDASLKISGDRDIFLQFYRCGAKFQVEEIPVCFFSMDGVSNKKMIEEGIPEDKKISEKYGLSKKEIDAFYNKNIKQWGKIILKRLAITVNMYRLICKISGRGKKFISDSDLNKLGIIRG